MKSVAIISDIHANLPALTAVLEDIDKLGIEETVHSKEAGAKCIAELVAAKMGKK